MIIRFDNVSYTYQKGHHTSIKLFMMLIQNLNKVNIMPSLDKRVVVKSTLIQNINALLKPTTGTVTVDDITIT